MYSVDHLDSVVELKDIPAPDAGAPHPILVAGENRPVVAYYVSVKRPGRDGTSVEAFDPSKARDPVAIIEFFGCTSMMFGDPNDEAFSGHPLAGRGLHPYGAFEVHRSSWIRGLERMNSVHSMHRPERYRHLRHLVLAFHDSTFECVVEDYEVTLRDGPVNDAIGAMIAKLAE